MKSIKYHSKNIWTNKKEISRYANNFTGIIYTIIGIASLLVPLDEILPEITSLSIRLTLSITILLLTWMICFTVISVIVSLRTRFTLLEANNDKKVYIQYGDLFAADIVIDSSKRRNIVIPVNCCFDTRVDDKLISANTLHGKVFNNLYESGNYTPETLSVEIQKSLSKTEYVKLTKKEKPKGNLKQYPEGTTVDLIEDSKKHYLLLALSKFDENLNAQTAMEEYVLAIQRLIQTINSMSQGYPVIIPLIGTGLSRTKKESQDLLSYLVNALKINRSEINCDIHIVIEKSNRDKIKIMNIC